MTLLKPTFPDWTGKLWWRLSLTFFVLSMICMVLLVVVSSLIASSVNNWRAFHARVNAPYIGAVLRDQERLILSPMLEAPPAAWPTTMAAQLATLLSRLEGLDEDGLNYSIELSSDPVAGVVISRADGSVAMRHVTREGHVFGPEAVEVTRPVLNDTGERVGTVVARLDAAFDPVLDASNALAWAVNVWLIFVVSAAVMGVVFGLVAAKYVTSRLRVMNLVTEEWRQGKFDARIMLGTDDELTIHSRRLNRMAQDLELLFSLKQSMAAGDERNRVARELHDTVKQKLFALSLQLEVVKRKPAVMAAASEPILEAETITREAQADLMGIITQLRPPASSETSLADQIARIAEDFRRRFGVRIDLPRMATGACSLDTEHHVSRIVQEALMNAIQHGGARTVTISADVSDGTTTLTIEDDGSGFDPSRETGGFGLVSMRDRAGDLPRGHFRLDSRPGGGTRITLSWKPEP